MEGERGATLAAAKHKAWRTSAPGFADRLAQAMLSIRPENQIRYSYTRISYGSNVTPSTLTFVLFGNVRLWSVFVAFKGKRYAYRLKIRLSLVPSW